LRNFKEIYSCHGGNVINVDTHSKQKLLQKILNALAVVIHALSRMQRVTFLNVGMMESTSI